MSTAGRGHEDQAVLRFAGRADHHGKNNVTIDLGTGVAGIGISVVLLAGAQAV
jgi:hypothetical protein